mgnify:CR=1 FL=1
MFRHGLICTDFEDGLQRLLKCAPDLAAGGLERLVFAHSVPLWEEGGIPRVDEASIQAARDRLQSQLPTDTGGLEVILEVPSGRPADTLPKLVKQHEIDVIFTGASTRSFMQEKVFGSTTLAVAKGTRVPLMVLRPQLISTYTREELALRCRSLWRYLLIPYNDSEAAQYLLTTLKQYAQEQRPNFPKYCMLVWVVPSESRREGTERSEYRLQQARERLAVVKAELEAATGLVVHMEVRQGDTFTEIVDAALEFDISAIATSYISRGAVLDLATPSFANEMVRRSWFPILLFSPMS